MTANLSPSEYPFFSYRPVKVSATGGIEDCPKEEAQWVGVYRHNDPTKEGQPSTWLFDIALENCGVDYALEIADEIVEVLEEAGTGLPSIFTVD